MSSYISEGANIDIGIEFNKIRLDMVKDKAAFNSAVRSGDYKTARFIAYKINKKCDDFYNKLCDIDIKKSEAVIGTLTKATYDAGITIAAMAATVEGIIKIIESNKGGYFKKSEKAKLRKIINSGQSGATIKGVVAGFALEGTIKVLAELYKKVSSNKNIEPKDLDAYYLTVKQKMKTICAKAKLLINDVDILEKRYGAEEKRKELEQNVEDSKNIFKESEDSKVSKPWFIKASDDSINACVKIKGYDKPFRARSSMLIIKDIDTDPKVYFSYSDKDKEYHAPGGGWNEKEEPMKAAMREAKEECHMNVKIVKPFGERLEYYDEVRDWVKDHVDNPDDWWYGYYSKIFVGQYGSDYTGKVNDEDEDPEINSGKFYNFEDIKDKIYPEYRKAIEDYLNYWNKTVKESEEAIMDKDLLDVVVESDINEIKESDPEILAVYKECAEGHITEEQREDIITSIRNQRSASAIIKEAQVDEDSTLKDKFNEIKRIAYERCENGEFSEDTREEIINAAYNKLFNVTEEADITKAEPVKDNPAETKKEIDEMNKNIDKEMNANKA